MFLKARLFKSWAGTITSFVAKLGYLNNIFNCSQKFYGPAPRDDSGLSCIFSIVMCSIMSDHALYRSDVALTVCMFWLSYFRQTFIVSRPNKERRLVVGHVV